MKWSTFIFLEVLLMATTSYVNAQCVGSSSDMNFIGEGAFVETTDIEHGKTLYKYLIMDAKTPNDKKNYTVFACSAIANSYSSCPCKYIIKEDKAEHCLGSEGTLILWLTFTTELTWENNATKKTSSHTLYPQNIEVCRRYFLH